MDDTRSVILTQPLFIIVREGTVLNDKSKALRDGDLGVCTGWYPD